MGACGDVVLGERVITHARAGEAANMSQAGSKSLAVALYSERVPMDGPSPTLIQGDSLGIVRFLAGQPHVTLTAVLAAAVVGPFGDVFARGERPLKSPTLSISLPSGSAQLDGWLFDIVLFDDRNRDGQLDADEPYVSSWTGRYRRLPCRLPSRTDTGPPRCGAGVEPPRRRRPADISRRPGPCPSADQPGCAVGSRTLAACGESHCSAGPRVRRRHLGGCAPLSVWPPRPWGGAGVLPWSQGTMIQDTRATGYCGPVPG